jgi:magnesium chelatase subunit H
MMRKPTSAVNRTPIRVVVVTMDSHLGGALARAESALKKDLPNLTVVMHAADEWTSDPDALTACHADIARADIIIAAMLFLEDHIQAVLPALRARRDSCDALVGLLSASEIVKLTRVGKFEMSGEAQGAIAWLKRMRGKGGNESNARGQMKMLRQVPKLLRFIPGTAQDVRAYFMTLQYWLAGSEENLGNMVKLLVGRYAAGERAALAGVVKAASPIEYPEVGLYHPRAKLDHLPAAGKQGRVGVLLLRSYALSSNSAHYDGVIEALEAKGLQVVPAFASGLDQREAVEKYFTHNGKATVDAVVSLTGFSLVGGPAYNDAHAAETLHRGAPG